MKKQSYILSALVVFTSGSATAAVVRTATDPSTLAGARTSARAGATVADTKLTQDALFLNPASAAFEKTYTVGGTYKGQGDSLIASIVDSKSGPVGGGIYYARRSFDEASSIKTPGEGSQLRTEDRLAASGFGKLSDEFAVGAVLKWSRFNMPGEKTTKWNFNAGALYRLSDMLSFGVVAQNLMKDKKGFDPTTVTGGAQFTLGGGFSLSGQLIKTAKAPDDAVYTFPDTAKTLGWAAGLEYLFTDNLGVRGGYKDNPVYKEKTVAMGAGYQTPNFSLDYALEILTEQAHQKYHTVTLSAAF